MLEKNLYKQISKNLEDIFGDRSPESYPVQIKYSELSDCIEIISRIYENKEFHYVQDVYIKAIEFMILLEKLGITFKENRKRLNCIRVRYERYGKEVLEIPLYIFTNDCNLISEKMSSLSFVKEVMPFREALLFEQYEVFTPTEEELYSERFIKLLG